MGRPWPDDPTEFVMAYLDAWNEGDVDRVCDAYHLPSGVHKEGRVVAYPDEAAVRADLGGYVDSTRAELAGGTRWTCPSLTITSLGSAAALATARWVFSRPDGTVLEDYPDSYVMVRVDGRWFFMADVIHA